MFFRKEIEFKQACLKKIAATLAVRVGIMMKCRGNLNQALQKQFVRVRCLQPHLFPMFMCIVEMAGIKGFKSFWEQPIFFQGVHEFLFGGKLYRRKQEIITQADWPFYAGLSMGEQVQSACVQASAGAIALRTDHIVCNRDNRAFEFLALATLALSSLFCLNLRLLLVEI